MAEARRASAQDATSDLWLENSAGRALTSTMAIGLGVAIVVGAGSYVVWPILQGQQIGSSLSSSSTARTSSAVPNPSPSPKPEVPLTEAAIEILLTDLEQAVKRKDVDGVLRHIAPDAVILIRMKQGNHQQTAMLTREEYRKALASEFAFPSANDFTRVNTTVSMATDERTAKVSFKTTETLVQTNREIKVEGDETLVVAMRGEKPAIISLEKGVPGDST
jgi:hypothetical protein